MMNPNAAALLGRILLATLFLLSGFMKIPGFEATAGMMASKGLPMPQVLLAITIVVEMGGGLMIIAGFKARWAALGLFLWLIPVTLVFHRFWGIDAAQAQGQMTHFLKNLSIMGGMALLFAFGPGAYSIDKR